MHVGLGNKLETMVAQELIGLGHRDAVAVDWLITAVQIDRLVTFRAMALALSRQVVPIT